jgi:trans-aconitate methyltransferase
LYNNTLFRMVHIMNMINILLENPLIYSMWANPLNRQKRNMIQKILPEVNNSRVLDIGCGPASNTSLFLSSDYTGIDSNPYYIDKAKKIYPQKIFFVQDVTNLKLEKKSFDLIYINALLHHLNDDMIKTLMTNLYSLMSSDGKIVLLEPIIPHKNNQLQTILMKLDRGDYYRSPDEYCQLSTQTFYIEKKEIFPLKLYGITGWLQLAMLLGKKSL